MQHSEYVLRRLALQWVNDVLPGMKRAVSLHDDFRDGRRLVMLAGAITQCPVVDPVLQPRTLADCIANVRSAVFHIQSIWGFVVVGISPAKIVQGDAHHTLELLALLALYVSSKHDFVTELRRARTFPHTLRIRKVPPAPHSLVPRAREAHIAPPAPITEPLSGEVGPALSNSTLAAPAPSAPAAATALASAGTPPRLRPTSLGIPLNSATSSEALSPFRPAVAPFADTDENYFTPRNTRVTDTPEGVAEDEEDHFSDFDDGDISPVKIPSERDDLPNPFEDLASKSDEEAVSGSDDEEMLLEPMSEKEVKELGITQDPHQLRRRPKKMLCPKKKLEDLTPAMVKRLPRAVMLDVSRNALAAVPPALFTGGTHLQRVDISSNKIAVVGEGIAAMTALRVLDIGLNSLTALPAALWQLPALRTLSAPFCQIKDLNIPEGGEDMVYAPLHALMLNDNCIEKIPAAIGRITTLNIITLNKNAIEELPHELTALTALTELGMVNNKLKKLPSDTSRLKSLHTLNLRANEIEALPSEWFDGVHRAPPLVELFLQGNKINELPVSFFTALPDLANLDVSRNNLRFLPASIVDAHNLDALYVAQNSLQRIPPGIGLLDNLAVLDVSCNCLQRLPDLTGCTSLQSLSCSYNPLRAAPPVLPQSLIELQLCGCDIVELPRYNLPNLTVIMLAANRLTRLDLRGIVDPNLMVFVDVAHNCLTEPPIGILAYNEDGPVEILCDGNPFCENTHSNNNEQGAAEEDEEEEEEEERRPPADPESCAPRLGVGYAAMQGRACLMEDVVCIRGNITGADDTDFVAIFDGHGDTPLPTNPATTAALTMFRHLEAHLAAPDAPDARACLCDAVAAADAACAKLQHNPVQGTACVAALVCAPTEPGARAHFHLVNLGDSRAVLCTAGKPQRLTTDYCPTLPSERERIIEAGGYVGHQLMVQSQLAATRTIGDAPLHPFVTAEPECRDHEVQPDDEFLVLASDGVWDGLTDSDAVAIVRAELARHNDPARAAHLLRDTAFNSGTYDNITVIVVVFPK